MRTAKRDCDPLAVLTATVPGVQVMANGQSNGLPNETQLHTTIVEKRCRTCGALFHPTASRIKRGDYQCKTCHNAQRRTTNAQRTPKDKARIAEARRKYRARHDVQSQTVAYQNLPDVRERRNKRNRKYRVSEKLRVRHLARERLRKAVKAGIVIRLPCERCGALKSEGHHPDYSCPLSVLWLCRSCHKEHHRLIKTSNLIQGSPPASAPGATG